MFSKKNYAVLLVLFLILFTKLSAQDVVGTVSDSLSNNRLNGAVISLTGSDITSLTNQNGEFILRDIPSGEYLLEVNYFGYDLKKVLVKIDSVSQVLPNIQLNSSSEKDGVKLLSQSKSQLEEINAQLKPTVVKESISGSKLQNLADENLFISLSRLPGVYINYKRITALDAQGGGIRGVGGSVETSVNYIMPPEDNFPVIEDQKWKLTVRGLGSENLNVKYNGISLLSGNALDNSLDLGLIPLETLQKVELLKTITSDEDGDASAGLLKLGTGKALSERKISAQMFGNYNDFENSYNQYRFVGSYGERFFNDKLGIKINADIAKENNSSELFTNRSFAAQIMYTESKRSQGGANITIDYNTGDGGNIVFNNFYKKSKSKNLEYILDSTLYRPDYRYKNLESEQEYKVFSLAGNNYLFGLNIDWSASFSEAIAENPFNYLLSFRSLPNVPINIDEFIVLLDYTLENPTRTYSNQKNLELNLSKQFSYANSISGLIKTGFKYKGNIKDHNERTRLRNASLKGNGIYRTLADGTKIEKDFSGTRFDGLIGQDKVKILMSYFQDDTSNVKEIFDDGSVPLISQDALLQWRELNHNEYYSNNGSTLNSYNYSGSISSAYLMHTLRFKKSVDFIVGIRVESERNEILGYSFDRTLADFNVFFNNNPDTSRTISNNSTAILPNLQLLLKPSDFLNLRLSAYKTLIRPNYYQTAPKYLPIGYKENGYISMGNPYLKNADVWNYELQTQFYGKYIGVFSINAFLKDVNGMIQSTNGLLISDSTHLEQIGSNLQHLVHNFMFEKYEHSTTLFSYYNSTKPARIWGFEISHKMNMHFLPGYLKNIVLDYNLTFLRSETYNYDFIGVISAEEMSFLFDKKEKIAVAPEFFANIMLGYDIKGFSMRLSYVYQDNDKVNQYRSNPIIKNRYSRLDIALRQQIFDFVAVKLLLNNITDSKEEFSLGNNYDNQLTTFQKYANGMSIDFGIQIAF